MLASAHSRQTRSKRRSSLLIVFRSCRMGDIKLATKGDMVATLRHHSWAPPKLRYRGRAPDSVLVSLASSLARVWAAGPPRARAGRSLPSHGRDARETCNLWIGGYVVFVQRKLTRGGPILRT